MPDFLELGNRVPPSPRDGARTSKKNPKISDSQSSQHFKTTTQSLCIVNYFVINMIMILNYITTRVLCNSMFNMLGPAPYWRVREEGIRFASWERGYPVEVPRDKSVLPSTRLPLLATRLRLS